MSIPANIAANTTFEHKFQFLLEFGFFIGKRDPAYKRAYPGAFMVREETDDPSDADTWGITGDDIIAMIGEVFEYVFPVYYDAENTLKKIQARDTSPAPEPPPYPPTHLYDVMLSRRVTQYKRVIVRAENARSAEERALTAGFNDEPNADGEYESCWQDEDAPFDPAVESISEIDEFPITTEWEK